MRFAAKEAMSLTSQSEDGQDLSWSKVVFFETDEQLIREFKQFSKP